MIAGELRGVDLHVDKTGALPLPVSSPPPLASPDTAVQSCVPAPLRALKGSRRVSLPGGPAAFIMVNVSLVWNLLKISSLNFVN